MRLTKMFGLAALAAVAAMAFVGATSASATTNTQLCKVHTGLTCPAGEATTSVHLTLATGEVARLLTNLVIILCLDFLLEATPLALGNPQEVHVLAFTIANCGTSHAHNNCPVTVETLPLFDLLKTGLDEGSLTALNGQLRFQCTSPTIDCKYNLTNILLKAGAQHVTANKTPPTEIGSKFLCPDKPTLDWLLKTLTNTYVLQ